MKNYARIEAGSVVEIVLGIAYEIDSPEFHPEPIRDENGQQVDETVQPDDWLVFQKGEEIPIARRFVPEFVAALVEIPEGVTVSAGDTYNGGVFAPYVPPVPTAAEILSRNTAMRDTLLAMASTRIAPLQDAVDLEYATDAEVTLLKQWKRFRVDVNRVDLSAVTPAWPSQPT